MTTMKMSRKKMTKTAPGSFPPEPDPLRLLLLLALELLELPPPLPQGDQLDHEACSLCETIRCLGDDLMGYGKPDPGKKWWPDLEWVDSELRVPPKKGEKDHDYIE
jgi:hypothetical protein